MAGTTCWRKKRIHDLVLEHLESRLPNQPPKRPRPELVHSAEQDIPKKPPAPRQRALTDREKKMADIRAMSPDQMDDAVLNLKKERFNLRFQRATGQLENTSRMKQARREIARIKTVAAQKRAKMR